MTEEGSLIDLLVADVAGGEIDSRKSIVVEAGKGIVGDRYFHGKGRFSETLKGLPDVEVTLIEIEEIGALNNMVGWALDGASFRRNIVTRGVRLNDLVGKEFSIGAVRLRGLRLCEPCAHLAQVLGNEIMQHMVHKAGLRARFLSSGEIHISDTVSV